MSRGPILLAGSCHCGTLEVAFATHTEPEQLPVRTCDCSFCTRHAARCTSDPKGRVEIVVNDPARLSRYQFGLKTAEFFVCQSCGVYVGAVATGARPDTHFATLNVNVLEARHRFTREAAVMHYQDETEEARRIRREAAWTPALLIGHSPADSPGAPTEAVYDPAH